MSKLQVVMVGIAMVFAALFITAQEAESESYQDRYLIAYHTYDNVTPNKYNRIYKDVRDASAKRTMVDAARDNCVITVQDGRFFGPNSNRPFDCTSF